MTPDVGLQATVSFGRQLLFFLFLLVPGYFAVEAYYWANVAIEDSSRVNRIVLMAVGGFVSLAVVALWREVAPQWLLGLFDWLNPAWLVIEGRLSVASISRLSVLESTNLIVSESLVGIGLGYLYGTVKYVVYDQRQQRHTDLKQPWQTLVESTGVDETAEVVTSEETRVVGEVGSLGSQSKEYDILLKDPRRVDGDEYEQESDVGFSYHHSDDISRVHLLGGTFDPDETLLQRWQRKFLQWLTDEYEKLPSPRRRVSEWRGDSDEGASRGLPTTDDSDPPPEDADDE